MLRDTPSGLLAARGAALASFTIDHARVDHTDAIREVWEEDVYHLDTLDLAGSVVVDIGAHIGAFTIRAAVMGARVLAFEPWPEAYDHLVVNLDRNGVRDAVNPLRFAAGPGDGPAELTLGRSGTSGMGIEDPAAGELVTVPVMRPSIIADHAAKGLGLDTEEIAVLKVDIEGGEHALFRCREMLTVLIPRCRRVMLETHPGPSLGAIVEALLPTHHVNAFGRPEAGGMIYADRY